MDYSLTSVFVVPVGNTLPTTGSSENLTNGQTGIFKDKAVTPATAGNASTANFLQVFQGNDLGIGTSRSDAIKASKVKKWYKVTGNGSASNEIYEVGNFTVKCGEDVTLTLRGHSSYLDTISFNGFTRSITVKAPCCDCGSDPCTDVDAEGIVNSFIEKIEQEASVQNGVNALNLKSFWTFEKVGTGANTKLRISSKALTVYGQPCDLTVDPYEYDRIYYKVFAYKNPETTVDFIVADNCDPVADVVLIQRSSYPRGTSDIVKQDEIDYNSYKVVYKHIFSLQGFNPQFKSWVTDGTVYDQYVIQFDEMDQDDSWGANLKIDERVILWVPTGSQSTAINAILAAYLGTAVDETGAVITTTTTTTTTSTTTSTTTTLNIP